MRRILTSLLIWLPVAVSVAAEKETLAPAPGPRHALVADGRASATIVLPEKPHPLEMHAAGELRKYGKEITGVDLPIVNEPKEPTGYGIWLGQTRKAASAGKAWWNWPTAWRRMGRRCWRTRSGWGCSR